MINITRKDNHSTWVAVEMAIGYGPRYADAPQVPRTNSKGPPT